MNLLLCYALVRHSRSVGVGYEHYRLHQMGHLCGVHCVLHVLHCLLLYGHHVLILVLSSPRIGSTPRCQSVLGWITSSNADNHSTNVFMSSIDFEWDRFSTTQRAVLSWKVAISDNNYIYLWKINSSGVPAFILEG